MSIADFREQLRYAHTVSELNSLLAQWTVIEGSRPEKEDLFSEWCRRREQLVGPELRGHDNAVEVAQEFSAKR
jgi:hypothetical protein